MRYSGKHGINIVLDASKDRLKDLPIIWIGGIAICFDQLPIGRSRAMTGETNIVNNAVAVALENWNKEMNALRRAALTNGRKQLLTHLRAECRIRHSTSASRLPNADCVGNDPMVTQRQP